MKIKVLHRGFYNRPDNKVQLLAEGDELEVIRTITEKSGDYYRCDHPDCHVDVEVENAEVLGTKLIDKDGTLYLTNDDILIVRYNAGDCDTIPFPLRTKEHRRNLASALFDEYECGTINERIVMLPNGEEFNIDDNLKDQP